MPTPFESQSQVEADPVKPPTESPSSPGEPPQASSSGTTEAFLTRQELAGVLKVSVRTIDRMVAKGRIPACRFGANTVRFDLPDVLAALGLRPTR